MCFTHRPTFSKNNQVVCQNVSSHPKTEYGNMHDSNTFFIGVSKKVKMNSSKIFSRNHPRKFFFFFFHFQSGKRYNTVISPASQGKKKENENLSSNPFGRVMVIYFDFHSSVEGRQQRHRYYNGEQPSSVSFGTLNSRPGSSNNSPFSRTNGHDSSHWPTFREEEGEDFTNNSSS